MIIVTELIIQGKMGNGIIEAPFPPDSINKFVIIFNKFLIWLTYTLCYNI